MAGPCVIFAAASPRGLPASRDRADLGPHLGGIVGVAPRYDYMPEVWRTTERWERHIARQVGSCEAGSQPFERCVEYSLCFPVPAQREFLAKVRQNCNRAFYC